MKFILFLFDLLIRWFWKGISRWPSAVSFFCASGDTKWVTQLREFEKIQLRWIHISLSLASRGDEATEESLVSVGWKWWKTERWNVLGLDETELKDLHPVHFQKFHQTSVLLIGVTHLAVSRPSESGHQVSKIMDAFSASLQHLDVSSLLFPWHLLFRAWWRYRAEQLLNRGYSWLASCDGSLTYGDGHVATRSALFLGESWPMTIWHNLPYQEEGQAG